MEVEFVFERAQRKAVNMLALSLSIFFLPAAHIHLYTFLQALEVVRGTWKGKDT